MSEEKSLIEIAIIPLVVAGIGVAGAVIGVSWTQIQARNRGKLFQDLIFREIEEVSPYPYLEPDNAHGSAPIDPSKKWTDYFPKDKKFIHKDVIENIKDKDNRDFVLGLNLDLIYIVTQFWHELDVQMNKSQPNPEQFLYWFNEIVVYSQRGKIKKNYKDYRHIEATYHKWCNLISEYERLKRHSVENDGES